MSPAKWLEEEELRRLEDGDPDYDSPPLDLSDDSDPPEDDEDDE